MGKKSVSTCWKNDIFYIQMKKFIFFDYELYRLKQSEDK